jgi:hypothetical protein
MRLLTICQLPTDSLAMFIYNRAECLVGGQV